MDESSKIIYFIIERYKKEDAEFMK